VAKLSVGIAQGREQWKSQARRERCRQASNESTGHRAAQEASSGSHAQLHTQCRAWSSWSFSHASWPVGSSAGPTCVWSTRSLVCNTQGRGNAFAQGQGSCSAASKGDKVATTLPALDTCEGHAGQA